MSCRDRQSECIEIQVRDDVWDNAVQAYRSHDPATHVPCGDHVLRAIYAGVELWIVSVESSNHDSRKNTGRRMLLWNPRHNLAGHSALLALRGSGSPDIEAHVHQLADSRIIYAVQEDPKVGSSFMTRHASDAST